MSRLPRVRRCGAYDLRDVDFVSTSTGWALGDRILATADGGRGWQSQLPS